MGVVGVFTVDATDRRGVATPTSGQATTTPASAPPSAAAALEAFVPVATKFVETHRGLRFKTPVKVAALSDSAFRQRVVADQTADADKAELEKASKVLEALGLVPHGTDVGKAMESLLSDAVVGFYDPRTKELVVRGAQLTPYVRGVVVHELTHALQDQHFDIDRPDLDKADDERGTAFDAVVEGDAVRVEDEYNQSLSAQERQQAEREGQSGQISGSIPDVLVQLLYFPYLAGPPFTEAVLRAGGQSRLDQAFVARPPVTSEQVMHPDKYLAREGAAAVPAPKADGPVIDNGVLGEYGIDLLLFPAAEAGKLSPSEVQAAGRGWGGDRYVAWRHGTQTCVRANIVMDTPNDTNQLVSALQTYASTRKGVTVTGTGPVVLTACG